MNLQKLNYINLHQDIAKTPQDHLSNDFMGPYNTITQGLTYAFTTICNLTGYLMTTSIPDKKSYQYAIQEEYLAIRLIIIYNNNNNLGM